jgi:hypothetical protein
VSRLSDFKIGFFVCHHNVLQIAASENKIIFFCADLFHLIFNFSKFEFKHFWCAANKKRWPPLLIMMMLLLLAVNTRH